MSIQVAGRDGSIVKVSPTGELHTLAANMTPLAFASLEGRAYSFSNVTYDPDALDTIIMLRNTGSKNFHICEITLSCDTATEWHAHLVTVVFTLAGTLSITPVNLNTDFGNSSGITAFGDETGNTQGAIIHPHMITVANGVSLTYNYNGAVVLAPGHAFGLDTVTASTAAFASVTGYQAA